MTTTFITENIWWNREFILDVVPINQDEFLLAKHNLSNDKVIKISGLPNQGKTSFLRRLIHELLQNLHIQPHRIIFIDGHTFEDITTLQQLIEANSPYKSFLFIDNADQISFSKDLKLFLKKNKSILKIVCTELVNDKNDIFEDIIEIDLSPLGFRDFVFLKKREKINQTAFENLKDLDVEKYFSEYILYGGLPKIVRENDIENKKNLLIKMIDDVVQNDTEQLIETIKQMALKTGELLNISEIAQNVGISRYKADKNILQLEELGLVSFLPSFDTTIKKTLVKSHKIFLPDLGLRNALINYFSTLDYRQDKLNLFLNFVGLSLAKAEYIDDLFFFRTTNQTEINFIIQKNEKIIPLHISTGKGEIHTPRILKEFTKKYKDKEIDHIVVITENGLARDKYNNIEVFHIPIYLFPFWNGVWNSK